MIDAWRGMECHIQPDRLGQMYDVYFYVPTTGPEIELHYPGGDGFSWIVEEVPSTDARPSLKLTVGKFEALAEAVGEHVPVTEATQDALEDTRQVRDRLLAILESQLS